MSKSELDLGTAFELVDELNSRPDPCVVVDDVVALCACSLSLWRLSLCPSVYAIALVLSWAFGIDCREHAVFV